MKMTNAIQTELQITEPCIVKEGSIAHNLISVMSMIPYTSFLDYLASNGLKLVVLKDRDFSISRN